MASTPLSTQLYTLFILILSFTPLIIAQSATTTAIQGGDNAPISAGPTSAAGADAEGGSGGQGGSVNLGTGSIIAIVVVVVVVILLGTASAILYFIAKRRQWKIRETLRRSAKRVTTILSPKPRTPGTPRSKGMSFSPRFRDAPKFPPPPSSYFSSSNPPEKPPMSRDSSRGPLKIDTSPNSLERARSTTPSLSTLPPALAAKKHLKQQSQSKTQPQQQRMQSRSQERRMDLEKRPGLVTNQSSAFDMDSPVKSSIWTKMFGTK